MWLKCYVVSLLWCGAMRIVHRQMNCCYGHTWARYQSQSTISTTFSYIYMVVVKIKILPLFTGIYFTFRISSREILKTLSHKESSLIEVSKKNSNGVEAAQTRKRTVQHIPKAVSLISGTEHQDVKALRNDSRITSCSPSITSYTFRYSTLWVSIEIFLTPPPFLTWIF